MNINLKKSFQYVSKVLLVSGVVSLVAHFLFFAGFLRGYSRGAEETRTSLLESTPRASARIPETPGPTPTPQVMVVTPQSRALPNWSGPELWEAVNQRRRELGVNALNNQSELCTIASIRLNELLDLGQLDGHEGFSTLPERRPDLKWIFEKYNISEFLVSGAESAEDAVNLWENTLGHKKLLTGGEYVWGCTYAQNSFGVAIAAY